MLCISWLPGPQSLALRSQGRGGDAPPPGTSRPVEASSSGALYCVATRGCGHSQLWLTEGLADSMMLGESHKEPVEGQSLNVA